MTPMFLAALLSASYVLVIRLGEPKHISLLPRNNEQVIRYRIKRVSLLCLAILILLPALLVHLQYYASVQDVFAQFGILPGLSASHDVMMDLRNVAVVIAKVLVLYMGPITHYFYSEGWASLATDIRLCFGTLQGFRDHVFAPVTEELVYRAAVASVLVPHYSRTQIMWLTPALFGAAHLHHGYTMYYLEKKDLATVAMTVTFQFVYTIAFGGLSNKVYFDTGFNFWATVSLHALCNIFGFPDLEWRQYHPRWFLVYCCMLLFGLFSFWQIL